MKKSLLSAPDRKKLNEAAAHEMEAAHMYSYFATCMQKNRWRGFEKFFASESAGEYEHRAIIAQFMTDRNDEPEMESTPEIDVKAEGFKDLLEYAYNKEAELEEFYCEFWDSSKDPTVKQFLLQFIEIQRKSIAEIGSMLQRVEYCKDDTAALMALDVELLGNQNPPIPIG